MWSTPATAVAARSLAEEGKNLSLRGCIRGPVGDPPGPTVPTYAADRRFANRMPVHSGRSPGKESIHSSPLSIYSAPGGLRQDPGRAAEWPAEGRNYGNGDREMQVLLAYGSRGGIGVMPAGGWL
jgi:hypothetical protein